MKKLLVFLSSSFSYNDIENFRLFKSFLAHDAIASCRISPSIFLRRLTRQCWFGKSLFPALGDDAKALDISKDLVHSCYHSSRGYLVSIFVVGGLLKYHAYLACCDCGTLKLGVLCASLVKMIVHFRFCSCLVLWLHSSMTSLMKIIGALPASRLLRTRLEKIKRICSVGCVILVTSWAASFVVTRTGLPKMFINSSTHWSSSKCTFISQIPTRNAIFLHLWRCVLTAMLNHPQCQNWSINSDLLNARLLSAIKLCVRRGNAIWCPLSMKIFQCDTLACIVLQSQEEAPS